MTAHPGRDLLLKLGDGESPETFATVAGLRTKTFSLNARSVDATHALSPGGWRELIAGAGLRQAQIAGSGVFLSDAGGAAIRALFFAGAVRNWRIHVPGLGRIEGAFLIANLDYSGAHDGEAGFALALDSAGALEFTEEI
jgi:TP901-1 family phage major tail protein